MEQVDSIEITGASVTRGAGSNEQANAHGHYSVECRNAAGDLLWTDGFANLVTTVGKNDALDKYLGGTAYTATWYLGLISGTSYSTVAASDTQASHGGWFEAGGATVPAYSQSVRQSAVFGAASAGSKATSSPATYSITSSGTVKGCFLTSVATKDGTTGILYSAGLFAGGDKVVSSGDSIAVSYQAGL